MFTIQYNFTKRRHVNTENDVGSGEYHVVLLLGVGSSIPFPLPSFSSSRVHFFFCFVDITMKPEVKHL